MTEPVDARVAVYIDFDNIVISRYDQVHGRSQFMRDKARAYSSSAKASDTDMAGKLTEATVDIGAVIDFASSFGTLVLTRAYADWSAPVNADYRGQLVSRAVDLVQLFPAAAYAKNGADIRLAVDAVEDMFRLPDLTHVIIVAGDSDYIALAQRCKRLGRYVVGIGVAGSTSRSLAAACDEFATYDALPGVKPAVTAAAAPRITPAPETDAEPVATEGTAIASGVPIITFQQPPVEATPPKRRRAKTVRATEDDVEPEPENPQEVATGLLERALRLGHEKDDDAEWLHSSTVKTQMKRMDPSFSEKALGFRTFTDFLESRSDIAEQEQSDSARLVRLVPDRVAAD
ncbi:NYN domain-containing protein [Labedella endophytica]|uniref:NYN domain-containing protein n=1 Tax=Labedella endophytica TaxID=1523160 RepID=A0A3S0WY47_9MICO|nr:NYN domain-containing protein [Labedella endophytica]RUR00891.1 NYN domain-containing protein [Labedella endophytica]